MIRLTATNMTVDAAATPDAPRTITGVAVPYGEIAHASSGQTVMFMPGSLPETGPAPKLIAHHDATQVHGIVTERVNTETAMLFTAQIARTRASDDIVELLKMGAIDAVSVGAEPVEFSFDKAGTMIVSKADWVELSLVTIPAFPSARISSVAASAADKPDELEPETEPETESENETMDPVTIEAAAVPTVATAPLHATPKRVVPLPSAAEYIAAANAGGDAWHAMSAALRAAAPDVVTGDVPGLLPETILGPVYNSFVGRRALIDSVGVKALPTGGKVFVRPVVSAHTSIGKQATENTALTAGTFEVNNLLIEKGTYGGYVTVSMQDIDWTDPNVVGLILDDMSRIYANETDIEACTVFTDNTMVQESYNLAGETDPAVWVAKIFAASAAILTNSNGNLPTHLWVGPDAWQNLGALSDSAGRPLFTQYGPMNSFGQVTTTSGAGTAFGLTVVVDRNMPAGYVTVGDPVGFECYEQQRGAMSIDNVSTISRTLSWHGYFAAALIDPYRFYQFVAP